MFGAESIGGLGIKKVKVQQNVVETGELTNLSEFFTVWYVY